MLIIWSAMMFGVFHLNFGQSIYAAALGVILAVIMYNTGNVKYPIIIHFLINLSGGIGIGQLALRSGNDLFVMLYSVFILTLLLIGIIVGVILLRRKVLAVNEQISSEISIKPIASFLNPGSLIFLAICVGEIIYGFFR